MTTGFNGTRPESAASAIGFITLQEKLARKPGTGNPYAGFDEAGVGNVTKGAGLRPTAKALAKPPDPTVGAPIPDPTAYHLNPLWGERFQLSRMALPAGERVISKVKKSRYDLDMEGF
jgi:hypothetical protein